MFGVAPLAGYGVGRCAERFEILTQPHCLLAHEALHHGNARIADANGRRRMLVIVDRALEDPTDPRAAVFQAQGGDEVFGPSDHAAASANFLRVLIRRTPFIRIAPARDRATPNIFPISSYVYSWPSVIP